MCRCLRSTNTILPDLFTSHMSYIEHLLIDAIKKSKVTNKHNIYIYSNIKQKKNIINTNIIELLRIEVHSDWRFRNINLVVEFSVRSEKAKIRLVF